MATASSHQKLQQEVNSLPPLKEGERLLAPSRRPDGTMRKPIRIRAGYTPQDEVAIYQSKGAQFRRGTPQVPPGYDPVGDAPQRPKTKSAKKNERRKEKKQQAAATLSQLNEEAANSMPFQQSDNPGSTTTEREDIEAVAQHLSSLSVSSTQDRGANKETNLEMVDLEKRLRALRKKIRVIESLQASLTSTGAANAEQAEKLSKLGIWRTELRDLEAQKSS